MKVKICGLSRECDIDYVNQTCPDYIGFIFAKSKRQVSPEQARLLKSRLLRDIIAVGVFVDATHDLILQLVQNNTIEAIQLHGDESNAYINALKSQTSAPIIKAINPHNTNNYDCDFLLYDNGSGGTGETFDWTQLQSPPKPYFLAGGINIGNIADAIKLNPHAIDISSGAEVGGFKDKDKIIEIVSIIRKAGTT